MTRSIDDGHDDDITEAELTQALHQWSADMHHDRAVEARAARRWQHQLTMEEMRFGGLLLDLAERRCTVTIGTVHGRSLQGEITAIGHDFVTVTKNVLATVLALAAVTWVRCADAGRTAGPPSARETPLHGPTMLEMLSALAAERPSVRFATFGSGGSQTGKLVAVGADVVTFELESPVGHAVFVPADQLAELALDR